ncbi:hypothetical protein JG687_00012513 [Phytophthora cactorum]|uniref:SET domain n=1 Tax=Phytophthora cactorum TaxID=29920 RepID=A0A8T1U5B6_9STRA|nr:hypothetical protein GQ600_19872 [Phytophthora cactorum]KAG6953222.1 hypothetical protein JG687_00012513 [Phytophthora cactorum]
MSEYASVLTTLDYEGDEVRIDDYVFSLSTRSTRNVTVVVMSVGGIAPGEEVTVDYGDLWLVGSCKSVNCRIGGEEYN